MAENLRCFENIAKLIKSKRLNHHKGYSQSELSHLLGYKNGQFISNVERALCNVPLKMLRRVGEVLDISPEEIKASILKDQELTLDNFLNAGQTQDMRKRHTDEEPVPGASSEIKFEGDKPSYSVGYKSASGQD